MANHLQTFLGDVVDMFVAAPRQQATDTGQSDADSRVRDQSRFIESNREYYRDLVMAIANYGTQGRMDGQGLLWEVRGVEGEWGLLLQELNDWKANANKIVVGNAYTIIDGIIDGVHEAVFAKPPGPSLTDEIIAEIINWGVEQGLEHFLGHTGAMLGLIASIVKIIAFDAWREHDMEAREEKFVELMHSSSRRLVDSILSDIYNLDTMFSYYETWLNEAKKARPEDFVH
ncbi:MAG: hypothetical protein ACRD2L_13850, partial [Terriglobia bacterium]